MVPIAGAARADDAQGVASSRMSYSRFLEYLDMGRVKKVQPLTHLLQFMAAEHPLLCPARIYPSAPVLVQYFKKL